MSKKMLVVLSMFVIAAMLLTSCGTAATPAATEAPVVVATTGPTEKPFKVGFVTDTGGIDDKSFNTTQWNGVLKAQTELGIEPKFIQSDEATQYIPNLTEFASQGYDLIIAAGWAIGADMAKVAMDYPDLKFSIVDYSYPDPFIPEGVIGKNECVPNAIGQEFLTDQPAFLAGYLAAGMTKTGKVGYFGGKPYQTVTIFAVGMQAGIEYYNQVHGTTVQLIGWDSKTGKGSFTDDFGDLNKGKEYAESLFDEGVDIFAGVGGLIGSPGFDVARERGGYGIWVDTDGYVSLPGVQDVILTSIMKNMDQSVFDVIKSAVDGTFKGCTNYIGSMANGGVGLAPYHDLDSKVPAALKAEIEALKAKMISGELKDFGCVSYPAYCPARVVEAYTK